MVETQSRSLWWDALAALLLVCALCAALLWAGDAAALAGAVAQGVVAVLVGFLLLAVMAAGMAGRRRGER